MNNISDNTYMGKIPGFQAGTHVQYKIIAYDKANNPAVEDKNGEYYIYTVIPEFTAIMFLLILVLSTIVIFIAKKRSPKTRKNKSTRYSTIEVTKRLGTVTFPPLKTLTTNSSITTTNNKKQQKTFKSYQFKNTLHHQSAMTPK